jgi:hypothetical protein
VTLDRLEQDADVKRLSDAVVRRQSQNVLLRLVHVSRDHELRNLREQRVVPKGVSEFPAVQNRHHQVEEDDVGPGASMENVESLLTVVRGKD